MKRTRIYSNICGEQKWGFLGRGSQKAKKKGLRSQKANLKRRGHRKPIFDVFGKSFRTSTGIRAILHHSTGEYLNEVQYLWAARAHYFEIVLLQSNFPFTIGSRLIYFNFQQQELRKAFRKSQGRLASRDSIIYQASVALRFQL
jgi:hypothetical protein